MTAEPIEDVWVRMPRSWTWTWADLQDIPDDGHRYEIIDGSLPWSPGPSRPHPVTALDDGAYREVATVRAGESVTVDVPFPVELRPAGLVDPRRS